MAAPVAAISFTGGKDCTLAMLEARAASMQVQHLITFARDFDQKFLAHDCSLIRVQAQALGIPHQVVLIDGQPTHLDSYQRAIRGLRENMGIEVLVTGDMEDVCSGFMERAAEGTGVRLFRPLWQMPRDDVAQKMFEAQLRVIITCVDLKQLSRGDAERLVGAELTRERYEVIRRDLSSIDACGERGEFHTMVVGGPQLAGSISVQGDQAVSDNGEYMYFKIDSINLAGGRVALDAAERE